MDWNIVRKPKARWVRATKTWMCHLEGTIPFSSGTLDGALRGWRLVNG